MYSEEQVAEVFEKIILEIENGKSLNQLFKEDWTPSSQTFYIWLEKDEAKSKRYARACEVRADTIFEQILEIADDSSQDTIIVPIGEGIEVEKLNPEFVQRSRLRVDARKWVVAKLNPKKYGDKIEQTHLGEMTIKFEEQKTYEKPKDEI